MADFAWPEGLFGLKVHLVGIKGTGMAALAELLSYHGARVSGSDTHETFYTDEVLRRLGIPYFEGFSPENLPPDAEVVVYSAAYNPETHPELVSARSRGLDPVVYTGALGAFSALLPSAAVAGVHGKTTTTAMAGTLVNALELSGMVLAGSAVASFGDKSTVTRGRDFFIAETCEYRRHFLAFHPRWMIVTSVEADHLDYFKDAEDVRRAFVEFGLRLAPGGTLVYCADDRGAFTVAGEIGRARPDLVRIPYGETAEGRYRVLDVVEGEGETRFRLEGGALEYRLRIPGRHSVLNATAALALVDAVAGGPGRGAAGGPRPAPSDDHAAVAALAGFSGSRRRSEILGEVEGVLFADDYAHHPTAIRTTLAGFRRFYPRRRIVADFMSHTYSRTKALLDDFAASFGDADVVLLHKIYASAREAHGGSVCGRDLCDAVATIHPDVTYVDEPMDALVWCATNLRPGDLFITLGAGDNWRLGREAYRLRGTAA